MGNMSDEQKQRREQEVTHCRLAMVAFTGAAVQTLNFPNQLLLG